jgi:phosphoenolpyruvate synthase/pyruvate phosphate dikinase
MKCPWGKGAHLAELRWHGFVVPLWFTLSSDAYLQFIGMVDGVREARLAKPELRLEIVNKLRRVEFCPDWRCEIDETVRKALSESKIGALVVRSSANVEDGGKAAFAGQFDTFLGVDHVDQVWESIRACWISVYSNHTVEYARRMVGDIEPVMAVVVQEFVPADVSGVMFTANPLRVDAQEFVIESTWGLGQSLVDGEILPDRFLGKWDEDGDEFTWSESVEPKVGTKTKGFFWNSKSRIIEERVNARYFQRQLSLNENHVSELARLEKNEIKFGCPQDIEWVLYEDQFYVVQTRPVTVS